MTDTETKTPQPWQHLESTGSELAVHDFLTTRLSALMTLLRRELTRPYTEPFGLTVPEWRVLSLIAHTGSLSFSALVIQSTSDKALVSRTVRALEKRGLISVLPESPTARKRLVCEITAEGRALHAKVFPLAQKRQAEALGKLTAAERKALFGIIAKLTAAMDEDRG